ncbi:MAG: SET domain-containing protein [Rhodomicrobium sp.]
MMLVRTYLSNSTIEGVGIYAAEPIKAGDVIWRLEPKFDVLVTDQEIEAWPAHMDGFIDRYCYQHRDLPKTWVLELDNGRFMNHSNTPNSNFEEFYVGYATRDILPGEEITCSYFDFDINFRGNFSSDQEMSASLGAQ